MNIKTSNGWLIFAVVIALLVFLLMFKRSEGYSPFRRTGGCPPRTGYNYLDVYEQQDYYKKYPYIYPTPYSYITSWYSDRRRTNKEYQAIRAAGCR